MIEAANLKSLGTVRHGFFTRQGGRSEGIYLGLNTGLGSNDDRLTVVENRDHVRKTLAANALVTAYQFHSALAINVTSPWPIDTPPRADALVTVKPGLAIAVNTADCTPVLFSDGTGTIIGAAHAGWKGAITGVLEATVQKMIDLGADRYGVRAAIGPTISSENYEVGPEFRQRFVSDDPANNRFFKSSPREGHFMFDLPGFVRCRLETMSLAQIDDLEMCTYAREKDFFSYRRTTHRNEPDYGRQMSAIVIGE